MQDDGSNQLGQQIEAPIPPQRTMLTLPASVSLRSLPSRLSSPPRTTGTSEQPHLAAAKCYSEKWALLSNGCAISEVCAAPLWALAFPLQSRDLCSVLWP